MKKLNKKPWKFLSKKQLHKKKIDHPNKRARIENSKELNKNEKGTKICLKQKYWGYCFKCNIENKLQELILKSYPVSFENMTDEHWELGRKN